MRPPRSLLVATALSLGAALLAAPLVTSTAAVSAEASEPAAFRASPIAWGRCRDAFLRSSGARCGMLTVPLDHADPTGPTIRLAVSRVAHTGRTYRGVMFTNPGGPGGSGTFLAAYGQFVPGTVARTYDWIGVDPRGVGASRPALTCDVRIAEIGTRPPSYYPTSDAILDQWLAKSETYAADCGASRAAALLPHMRTTDTVADLEVLREALGAEQVSFYGFSYGTYLAQVYATLHPDRIDKLVLDGVLDPRGVWFDSQQQQNRAFEKAMGQFWTWAARANRTYRLGRTGARVEKTYYRVLQRVTRKPVNGVGGPEVADLTLSAGYSRSSWPDVASMLSEVATKGTARRLRKAYTSGYPTTRRGDNGYATYLATLCTDAPWPTDLDALLADYAGQDRSRHFFTWPNAWYNGPCRTWPAAPGTPVDVATSDQQALLISETFDGATPFAGALEVRRRFGGASLIEGVGGTTHAGSLSGIACVDDRIAAYLASGRLPKRRSGDRSDVRCPAIPAPPAR
ncbi:alpha/beta hydrolase [Nocardioides hwasunensis]|uniref:Alpha/beta fold hydrolase n=1 Tax=Nocardioides hwasunensis TaxID=397258 RepID=A0ABR8MMW7_9ACTN|nr:alpha/beta hydrolase [Nocardioides hwasunensis]MBD3916147.1 alpha/beta fold hydrolase [Nocardioides hwasunensis]